MFAVLLCNVFYAHFLFLPLKPSGYFMYQVKEWNIIQPAHIVRVCVCLCVLCLDLKINSKISYTLADWFWWLRWVCFSNWIFKYNTGSNGLSSSHHSRHSNVLTFLSFSYNSYQKDERTKHWNVLNSDTLSPPPSKIKVSDTSGLYFLFLILFYYILCLSLSIFCLFLAQQPPQWARASSFMRFLDHTQWRTTVGRTPLDEW